MFRIYDALLKTLWGQFQKDMSLVCQSLLGPVGLFRRASKVSIQNLRRTEAAFSRFIPSELQRLSLEVDLNCPADWLSWGPQVGDQQSVAIEAN